MVNLGNAHGKILIDGSGALSTISQVRGGLGGLGRGFGLARGGALAFGAALTAGVALPLIGAGAAVTGFIGSSTKLASGLEAQMDGVQAVMGNTTAEIAQLKELVTDLGVDPNLKVSSLEAAEAIEMLGRNGLDTQQILDGAARSTVLLSNATGGNFGQSADIATDVMALFNIEAADMAQAVNGITSVVNNSKFSINDYALALAQGGGIAASVGVEFDDFNTAIAGMSPLFASGSDAGTSFKVMLQNLIPKSKDAAATMRSIGLFTGLTRDEYEATEEKLAKVEAQIAKLDPTSKRYSERLADLQHKQQILAASLETGQNAFFDSEGNMKSMAEIAGVLQGALSGLSEERKNEALATIFGTDA